jgi:uncharacterized protein
MLHRDDAQHAVCTAESSSLPTPLVTTWPVLTEAAWLLRDVPGGVASLLRQVEQGLVAPIGLTIEAAPWMSAFLTKYRSLGAQLADASLCYVAEQHGITRIFTLDRRDFGVYRTSKGQPFELIPATVSF